MVSLFYESVLEVSGGVSIYIAWGVTSRGKSNSVQVALAAAGNHAKGYKTYLSESSARRYLSGALPFAFDDPNNGVIIKQLLINAFQKWGRRGVSSGHAVFLLSLQTWKSLMSCQLLRAGMIYSCEAMCYSLVYCSLMKVPRPCHTGSICVRSSKG